ncbi:MAG: 3'-5' exonuclease [Fusobacteriaceae bacterium]|nr:3'-5' exonuclease [Fusobacteriaceae bacterium]
MDRELIIFDTETNGMGNCSVLSIACIKLLYNFKKNTLEKIGEYSRFYFRKPGEIPNQGALKVNGLYDYVIEEKRKNVGYPKYFLDDTEDLKSFIGECKHFVAHNIAFDRNFIPFRLKYQFCTMNENVEILKILKGNSYKWPKLSELSDYYRVPYENDNLHDSYYDTLILARVVFRMLNHKEARKKLLYFLEKN